MGAVSLWLPGGVKAVGGSIRLMAGCWRNLSQMPELAIDHDVSRGVRMGDTFRINSLSR